ncbi:TonB-dependent receptor [Cognatiluteimonas lumbrici]|uniref:TonB-dependent receptor n=1 Tax=Cognatiluteimonas lumbrici TaxID=2559601 RepID=UPI0015E27F9B|nr:TonB-dependent receptor [Luteimonas lumbrici]
MPRFSLLAAAILGGFSVLPAHAQDHVTDFDKVTVSASTSRLPDSEAALPNTITVITAEQLQEQLAVTRDLSQVLANLIPAFAPSRQKMSSFGESLRGRQPLYMVDGVPQSTPLRDGSRDAHTIDPAMIERIEVIHGANALQGLGASGGIINIITRRAPRRDGSFHEVTLGASTALPRRDDGAGYRGSWLFGTRKGAFDFVGGASYAQEGLYYDGDGKAIAIDPVQGDLMDARSLSLFGKAGWDLGDARRLQLSVNRYRLRGDGDYLNLPGDFANGETATSVPGEPPLDPPQNDSTTVSLDYSDFALAGGYLQAQLYWTRFDARYGAFRYVDFFNEGTDDTWFDQTNIGAEKHGAKFTWSRSDIAGLPLRLTAGLDVTRDTTEQRYLAADITYVPPTAYESLSPLLQAEYRIGDFLLTGGLRHERARLVVDDYVTIPRNGSHTVAGGAPEYTETLPNFGVVWEAGDALKLYASYAEGYTVADVGRVLRGIKVPDQDVDELVDLTPVVADNREIGLDWDDGRWLAHVAAYWSDSDLGSLLIFDAPNNTYNVQRQATSIRGLEANVAFRLSVATRLGLAHARTEGRYDSDGDDVLDSDLAGINISPDRTTGYWEQDWTPRFSTRLQGSVSADRDFDFRGAPAGSFDGYAVFDLQASIAFDAGTLNLGVENLFDRKYISYFSQTTPADDDYNAGRGRALTASWTMRF